MIDFPSIPMTTEETIEFDKWLEEYKKQIRADAIEEFVKAIRESKKGNWRTTCYEHGESVCETMSYDIGVIKMIAEQLKGAENENIKRSTTIIK